MNFLFQRWSPEILKFQANLSANLDSLLNRFVIAEYFLVNLTSRYLVVSHSELLPGYALPPVTPVGLRQDFHDGSLDFIRVR